MSLTFLLRQKLEIRDSIGGINAAISSTYKNAPDSDLVLDLKLGDLLRTLIHFLGLFKLSCSATYGSSCYDIRASSLVSSIHLLSFRPLLSLHHPSSGRNVCHCCKRLPGTLHCLMSNTPNRNVCHVYNEVRNSQFAFSSFRTSSLPRKPSPSAPSFLCPTISMPKAPPAAAAHPPLGTLIDDDSLELVEVLGVGGYGVVYRAVDTRSVFPKSYAVKCLVDTQPQQNSRQKHVHIREITLHQLASAHPNVVTLHRVIEDYNHTYIVMDYAKDGDLFSQILHSCRYLGHDHLIKHVFLQLLDAVEYCHSLGIYHRDLKPENILCFDGGLRVAITDFGLATTDKVSEEFRTGSVYHMSPGMLLIYYPLSSIDTQSQNVREGISHPLGLTHRCSTIFGHWL
jgi:Protein kinase domain